MNRPTHDDLETTPAEDAVAKLIRLAEGHGAVPAQRSDRVKSAVRAHWHGHVERRRRRTRQSLGGALALAAALLLAMVLLLRPGGGPAPEDGTLGRVVAVAMESSTTPVHAGQDVTAGFELDSGQGRVALLLGGTTSVRLDLETRVRVLSAESLALEQGRVYVDSGPGRGSMKVATAAGTLRDIGTQFEVEDRDGTLRVRVREGKVILDTDTGSHEMDLGEQIDVDASGGVVRSVTDVHGPSWDWTSSLVPMLPLEGHSAREFLDWAARERGWQLRFSGDDVERSASSIVLSGSADGLTIDQALDAVLPTCRMAHQVQDGVLLVSALD